MSICRRRSRRFLVASVLAASLVPAAWAGEVTLLDESWNSDLKFNEVVVETSPEARSGQSSAQLRNVATPAGWPNVRFSAGDFELGQLVNAGIDLELAYRTDAWDGKWTVQVWAFLGSGEPLKILEGPLVAQGADGRLRADNNWHTATAKLTPEAAAFSTVRAGQKYPLYVWLVPSEGWGKTHTTHIDAVKLKWTPGQGGASAVVLPSDKSRGDGWVWIEGESPSRADVSRHPWWYEQVQKQFLSGGDFVAHFDDHKAGEVEYRFDAPSAGEHAFWLHANMVRNKLSYKLNDGPWTEIKADGLIDARTVAADGANDLRFMAWSRVGAVELKQGANTVAIRMEKADAEQHHGMIDALVFASVAFTPAGLLKPDQIVGAADADAWFDFAPGDDAFTADAGFDLRSLNEKFAGENGFIVTKGDQFVHEKTGNPVRFWAVNGPNKEQITSPEEARRVARDLAKRGVNMVRLHGAVFDRQTGAYNAKVAEDLSKVIDAMREEGIYSHLSIYFPLWFTPAADVAFLKGYDGTKHPFAALTFNEAFQKQYQSWWTGLLNHKSPRTGRMIKDEPAVMGYEIINEDSYFFWTFSEANIPEPQLAMLETIFGTWAKEKYGSIEKAIEAWGAPPLPRDNPRAGRLAFRPLWNIANERSERDKATARFLGEHQHQFYAEMTDFLRKSGVKSTITASNWTTASAEYLTPIEKWTYTAGDFIDRHGYFGGFHEGEHAAWSLRDGHVFSHRSALRFDGNLPGEPNDFSHPANDPHYGLNDRLLPSMISETTFIRPNRYRTEAMLFYATYAALQDTDCIVHFAVEGNRWSVKPGFFMQPWMLYSPTMLGQSPATALLYRQGLIEPGATVVDLNVKVDDILDLKGVALAQKAALDELRKADVTGTSADTTNAAAIDPLVYYVGRTSIRFTDEERPSRIDDLSKFIDRSARTVTSTTGQVKLDYGVGLLRIDAPQVQAVSGNLKSGGTIELGQLAVQSPLDLGQVMLVSLDGKPIETSDRMLLQVMSEERNSGFRTQDMGGGKHKILSIGHDPWQVKKLAGSVRLTRGDARSLKVSALDPNGYKTADHGNAGEIELAPDVLFYLIER